MEYMFSGCTSLKTLDITNFNVSTLKKADHMFENCLSLTSLNLTNFAFDSIDNIDYIC